MLKLVKECNYLKEILSANKESQIGVEGFVDGIDFKSKIKRETFEQKSEHLFSKLTIPIEKVLKIANKQIEDIDQVEILGGGVRIPKIQQILSEYFKGKDLGAHLNGDEAMALGASFHGANLSHSFRVRNVFLNDGFSYEV